MDTFIESWYKDQYIKPTGPSVKTQLLQEYGSKHMIISEEECEDLWTRVCTVPEQPLEDVSISYKSFCALRQAMPIQFQRYLNAQTYVRMPKNKNGHMLGLPWMQYVLKTNGVHGIALELIQHSSTGHMLTKQEFSRFMFIQFGTEDKLDTELVEVSCAYLLQLLAKPQFPILLSGLIYNPVLLDIYDQSGWFARNECVSVYGTHQPFTQSVTFCDLNIQNNDFLTRDQMSNMCNGVLTDRFLNSLSQTYNQFTWSNFAAFQIAANNVHHPSAIRYLFRILDVDQVGYLSECAITEYVRDVLHGANQLNSGNQFKLMDIVNEVLDMTGGSTTRQITLQQLLRCGVGGTIIRLLVDVHGIAQYEQSLNSGGS